MEALSSKLRNRARSALLEARVYLVTAIIAGIGLIVYFTTFGGGIFNAIVAGGSISLGEGTSITIATGQGTQWDNLFAQIATRVGAVIIAMFVMTILVSFARYKFRIADNLNKMADICDVSGDDIERMKALSQFYLPEIGDITQWVRNPTENLVELAKEAVGKIPKI